MLSTYERQSEKQTIIMHTNYILNRAITTALALLSLSIHGQAHAIGLGEIEVRSHIGQPLQASIKVQGIGELKDKACFKLGGDSEGINVINHANLKLSNIKGDEGLLTITTSEVINEPITSLSIIAECDSNFRREYVLLIDPLLTTQIEQVIDEERISNVEVSNNVAEKTAVTAIQSKAQSIRVNNNKSSKSRAKDSVITKKSNTNNENIVLTVDYDAQNTVNNINKNAADLNASNITKNVATKSKPRLSISGGEPFNNVNSIGLRLDKQLHFSAETAPEAVASDISVADEATVLSNRLAHLEQQITALQQRNTALEAEKTLSVQSSQETKTKSNFSANFSPDFELDFAWWPYLTGFGLLLGGYFANFWRRRRQFQQMDNPEDVWNVLDANSNDDAYYKEFDLSDTLFESKPSAEAIAAEKATLATHDLEATQIAPISMPIEEESLEVNILDHADVFLSHGRTSLAIQLLQNHLMDFPKQSVTIWLFLLDLLAKENLQAMYEQTALECKEHFNIRIVAFSNDEASSKQNLEDFPRLTTGLEQVWGSPAALVYLDDLIYNSRLENRIGFEKTVLEELILLRSIAQSNVSKADIIQLDEKKMAIKELKDAKLAATKTDKLQKIEELTLVEAAKNTETAPELPEELFQFNLVEYK